MYRLWYDICDWTKSFKGFKEPCYESGLELKRKLAVLHPVSDLAAESVYTPVFKWSQPLQLTSCLTNLLLTQTANYNKTADQWTSWTWVHYSFRTGGTALRRSQGTCLVHGSLETFNTWHKGICMWLFPNAVCNLRLQTRAFSLPNFISGPPKCSHLYAERKIEPIQ